MKLQLPLKNILVTQPFGANFLDFYKQWGLNGHDGIDMRAHHGTDCFAAHDGNVLWAGDWQDWGINAFIRGEYDTRWEAPETIYVHLQDVTVKVGDKVKAGDLIGHTDNTGKYTTGDHLHFGLRFVDANSGVMNEKNGYSGWVDPSPYFEDKGWDLLPVSRRYGRFYDPVNPGKRPYHAYLSEVQVAVSLTKYLKRLPTNDEIKACVYGGWDRETVENPAMYFLWSQLKKDEYLKGIKPAFNNLL